MKFNLVILALLGLSISISSCDKDDDGIFCNKANGNLETRYLEFNDFNSIDLANSCQVIIKEGKTHEIEVRGSDNMLDLMDVEIKNQTLKLKMKKRKCIRKNDLVFTITMPQLADIDISGSGKMEVQSAFEGNSLGVNISGSGNFQLSTLNYKTIDVDISGSGYVNFVDGTVENFDVNISGSGDCKASQLHAQFVDAKISGSGQLETSVEQKLIGKISGSGSIKYKGEPVIEQSISGSGSIKKL